MAKQAMIFLEEPEMELVDYIRVKLNTNLISTPKQLIWHIFRKDNIFFSSNSTTKNYKESMKISLDDKNDSANKHN